ncbi:unnamed protein product [Schistosoma mattheei]|uniref:Uncharacterized protein n=1 Tax=Schistosoma mattheei TaxID=31246 RepID=A0AA85B3Y5_9TREM|nr:unnamed protein product [Schistosoma mattheei]
MSRLNLDNHGEPLSIGQPSRPSIGLLSSANPRSRLARFKLTTFGVAGERLTYKPLSWHTTVLMSNVGQFTKLRHRSSLSSVSSHLKTDPAKLIVLFEILLSLESNLLIIT